MSNRNKVALVTGANRGIGFETVRQLAAQGIEVFLAARTLESAQEAASKLQDPSLSRIHRYSRQQRCTGSTRRNAACEADKRHT